MASTSPTQNKSLIADWLFDRAVRSSVDDPPYELSFSMADREADGVALGYRVTTSRTPSDAIPFTIYFLNARELSAGTLPTDNDRSLTLLINPSELNYGSTQLVTSQYARKGFVNSLWGSSQGTLVGSGSSAAFMGPHYGLADPPATNRSTGYNVPGSSKRSSLAYGNLMSLVAVMRNNGYFPLADNTIKAHENGNPIPNANSNPSSPVAASLSGNSQKSRVVHVLSVVAVKYDGTTYLGSFNSFSLEDTADSPFRFSYSFEFAVSGLLGDMVDGHICNGENQKSGVIVKMQGSKFFTKSIQMNIDKVNDLFRGTDSGVTADQLIVLPPSVQASALANNTKEVNTFVDLKKDANVDFTQVQQPILDILPALKAVYETYVGVKPTINCTTGAAVINGKNRHTNRTAHGTGFAIDVNTNKFGGGTGAYEKYNHQQIIAVIQGAMTLILKRIGPGYFIQFEQTANGITEHIHIQYRAP